MNFLGLTQVPVFLVAMETVRKMCGANQGILGMVLGSGSPTSEEGAREAVANAGTGIGVEESFATEGALWFPNLLLPDPHLVLPFILSASILLNLFGHKTPKVALGVWRTRLIRGMGIAAIAMGPIMINVPSAMVLYWISSSLMAFGQAVVLEWLMPISNPVVPCVPKRPWKTGVGEADGAGPLAAGGKAISATGKVVERTKGRFVRGQWR